MKRMLVILMILFSACGPVYRISHSYTPPGDLAGNTCANQCQLTQQQCEQSRFRNFQSCEHSADMNYNLCQSRKIYLYNNDSGRTECISNCFCSRRTCNRPNTAVCTNRYNTCYLNCGGTVVSTTQCVKNCEEAEPPSTQVRKGARIDSASPWQSTRFAPCHGFAEL